MQKRTKNGSSLDNVVFHLLHCVSQRADDTFFDYVGEAGLTPRQFAVLLSVAESEGASQTDLCLATGIDRSTLGDMVERKVKKGLLLRRRSRQDARAKIVRLTDAGWEVLKSEQPKAARTDNALLARLSAEQRKALVEALKAISAP